MPRFAPRIPLAWTRHLRTISLIRTPPPSSTDSSFCHHRQSERLRGLLHTRYPHTDNGAFFIRVFMRVNDATPTCLRASLTAPPPRTWLAAGAGTVAALGLAFVVLRPFTTVAILRVPYPHASVQPLRTAPFNVVDQPAPAIPSIVRTPATTAAFLIRFILLPTSAGRHRSRLLPGVTAEHLTTAAQHRVTHQFVRYRTYCRRLTQQRFCLA